ncbi:MAG: NAD(P)/FAD-dependent oxidoreductase [Pyrinomonadaceae bacterium]
MKTIVKSKIQNPKSKILIVGAGPAGASLAIRLARQDFEVVLIEREKFPRHKLCGEFISPEGLTHFKDLGVLDEMMAVGGDRIAQTIFYSQNGKSVSVASKWFGGGLQSALSISRAEMDLRLLEKAKSLGVKVLEETQVVGLLTENEKVSGVKVRFENRETEEVTADLVIDATGRANVLGKLCEKSKTQNSKLKTQNSKLVGFKTHLENVQMKKGVCEIYSFRGGYGGLSFVENDLANHCFLAKAEIVREFSGNTDQILENVIFKNKRARETMRDAKPVFDWLAVSVESFGAKNLNPSKNLLTVGDAAAFIDPFTGSGMLMALESAEILAQKIIEYYFSFDEIALNYAAAHHEKFHKRLLVCDILRRAAFAPKLADWTISGLSFSRKITELLTRATRPQIS